MLNRRKNIILIGFMGSGKTTIGKILSENLSLPLIDTDLLIENNTGEKISKIFEFYGEKYFRNLEYNLCKSIKNFKFNFILSTGGGFPIFLKNRFNLKSLGIIFYLEASPEILFKRVKFSKDRPLINNFFSLYKKRCNIYRKLADFVINTEYKSPKEISFTIGNIYENCC